MGEAVFADLALARRLERAEGAAGARLVEARARLAPEAGAGWIEVAGAYAMYDGADSPLTQTFGLGMLETPTAEDMARLEAFFQERGAPVQHEVSPLAGREVLELLNDRGYRPVEFSSVMFVELGKRAAGAASEGRVRVRLAAPGEREVWARTAADGWREHREVAGLMLDLGRVMAAAEGAAPFLAELEGRPVAAANLLPHDGVALLAGASTVPEWRRRGAQRALLESRLAYAARAGCELAMMAAGPGSESQRNAERQGFRIAYTRVKWRLGELKLRAS